MNSPVRSRLWRSQRDLLLLGFILLIFVGGIYCIGDLYQQGKDGSQLTTISKEEVENQLQAMPNNTFRIDSVVRLYLDYPVYAFDVADERTVILNRPSSAFSGIKLSRLQVEDNELADIADNVEFGVVLSPDRNQLLYTQYDKDSDNQHNYMYQLKDKHIIETHHFPNEPLVYAGKNQLIGFNGNNFTLFETNGSSSATLQQTYGYDEMVSMIADISEQISPDEIFIMIDMTAVDPEGSSQSGFYVLAQVGERSGIYRFHVSGDEKQVEEIIVSTYLQQFNFYGDTSMLLQGTIGDTTGLYSFNLEDRSYKLLKEGDIWNYAIDDGYSRIAYLTGKDNRNNELHVAYLEDEVLVSDTVIYRNIDNLFMLSWYDKYLFATSYAINQTELYRFTLSGW
ncbi:hypothetical protein [Paenibacillus pinisoli]|uniref:hypothetical protein n=1 Tax=Paenibacillus pinisoli TaxID=1276110 RepID=UPI00105850B6|nr:hypothetical protein [Paenibacillus pinisoli]